jgi:hypothetical protein
MSRRAIVVTCALVGVVLTVAFVGLILRSSIPVWLAPDKTPTPSVSMSQRAKDANAKFWDAFHGGRYEQIPEVLEALTAAYIENPRDAETAAHIGFLHIWRVSEQARLEARSATITDHIVLSRKYFSEAVRLAPDDWRFKGFLASVELAEGSLHGDEKLTRRAYFDLMKAIDGWPEFNLFTAGFVTSHVPVGDSRYADAVDYQWRNLDVCAEEKVDRRTAQFDKYMAKETTTGIKRPCWNSWRAPHNFEGFFLNMGDMLVKQGDPVTARLVYANARLSKTYEAWPYKAVLQDRIAQAEENVALFRMPQPGEKTRTIMILSTFACTGCHQK